MKLTREIVIRERVFTAPDLIRIARILDEQKGVAKGRHGKSEFEGRWEDGTTEYEVKFDDNTRFQSDTPDIFQEELLTAHGRPVAVGMSYRNLSDGRYISVYLTHGDSSYGNEATVRGADPAWVNANFQSLQDALNRVRPQKVWVRRHEDLLFHLIALGIGCAVFLTAGLLDWTIRKIGWNDVVFRVPASWVQTLSALRWLGPLIYATSWFMRWLVGLFWGARTVWRWLLAMWPTIEFDFGPPHLQTEKIKRQRLASVVVLVIVPIFTSLLYDLIRIAF